MRVSKDIEPFWPKFQAWLDQFKPDLLECYEQDTQFDYSGYTQAVEEELEDEDATQPLYWHILSLNTLSNSHSLSIIIHDYV